MNKIYLYSAIGSFILLVICVYFMFKITRKKCKHKFVFVGCATLDNKLRSILKCKKCDMVIHKKMLSSIEFKRKEVGYGLHSP